MVGYAILALVLAPSAYMLVLTGWRVVRRWNELEPWRENGDTF